MRPPTRVLGMMGSMGMGTVVAIGGCTAASPATPATTPAATPATTPAATVGEADKTANATATATVAPQAVAMLQPVTAFIGRYCQPPNTTAATAASALSENTATTEASINARPDAQESASTPQPANTFQLEWSPVKQRKWVPEHHPATIPRRAFDPNRCLGCGMG